MTEMHPPLPPFTHESAVQKVRGAENGWNSCNPEKVSRVYTPDSYWRNRSEFVRGRAEIIAFLTRKWVKELDYRLIKELWAFTDNRIAVRFAYEWHDDSGNWFRSYGNENWEFAGNGLDAEALRLHQRSPDQGIRAQISLGSLGTSPCRSPGALRPRALIVWFIQPLTLVVPSSKTFAAREELSGRIFVGLDDRRRCIKRRAVPRP